MAIRVENMTSARGNTVANQFIIHTDEGRYFQSYNSVIAFIPYGGIGGGKIQLDENTWNYSTTTGKYRNEFLGEGIAETRAKIANGTYELVNLKL